MAKINSLEIENVKRIKAVKLEPTANGLTIIGGKNGQGKTSVLDSIAWALGGEKFRPSNEYREGSLVPPTLKVTLSNGLIVERKGKNSELKVTDSNGQKGGQQLLNEFIEQLALDLPRFMNSNNKEKANILLQIIGVGNELAELEKQENTLYNQRHAIGQIADQKKKFADEMQDYPNVPSVIVSAAELIKQQQAILAKNAENKRLRDNRDKLKYESELLSAKIEERKKELENLLSQQEQLLNNLSKATNQTMNLEDESTAELEKNIENIEKLNIKIRANMDKEKAYIDAENYKNQYDELSVQIDKVRKDKIDLLNGADLPLSGLSVSDGELIYNGHKWDCMSSSEQLKVSTAIVRKLKPECEFVLIDKLEQMDTDTLREFGEWLEKENLQAIATRVSTGEECSIIIEDGYSKELTEEPKETTKWKAGSF